MTLPRKVRPFAATWTTRSAGLRHSATSLFRQAITRQFLATICAATVQQRSLCPAEWCKQRRPSRPKDDGSKSTKPLQAIFAVHDGSVCGERQEAAEIGKSMPPPRREIFTSFFISRETWLMRWFVRESYPRHRIFSRLLLIPA